MKSWSEIFTKHRIAILIILAGILIRLPLVSLPLNYMMYPWRPSDTASIAHNFNDNGHNLFYPQIDWGGAGPGYVETEFQLYPFIVSLLYGIFGEHVWFGRFVSLIFTALTFIVFYALAYRLFKARIALWALAFFVTSPLYIHYSVEFMPEPTMMFFYVTALYLIQRWLDSERLTMLVLAAISTALAILVKPTSIHIGFIFLFLLVERYRLRTFMNWQVWLFTGISLLPSILWYLHARDLYVEYGNTFGVISGGDSKFGNLFSYWFSPGFYVSLATIDLSRILSYGGIFAFVPGIIVYLRKRESSLVLFGIIAVAIYYMLIPRYTTFADYYHLYFVPFAALGVGIGLDWLLGKARSLLNIQNAVRYAPLMVGVLSVVLLLGNSFRFYRGLFTPYAQDLVTCARKVSALVPESARVVISTNSYANDNGFANNYQDPIMFYFSHRYGWSLPADEHTPAQVEAFEREGAKYFVIYSQALYSDNVDLAKYLQANAQQIGPGVSSGCGIYRLDGA